ncbi:MAG: response regulator [Planctomycetota bacterium]
MEDDKQHICVVDDEPGVLRIIKRILESAGDYSVSCFTTADNCLNELDRGDCDLLISDMRMPGMDGMELLEHAKKIMPSLPVLIMTAYGDVPTAVKSIKGGAVDFIEKPFEREVFLRMVQSVLRKSRPQQPFEEILTKNQLRVLKLIVSGKTNKEVAELLGRSVRTIEDHRNQIMHKLDAKNVVELVKRVAAMGHGTLPDEGKRDV